MWDIGDTRLREREVTRGMVRVEQQAAVLMPSARDPSPRASAVASLTCRVDGANFCSR
jgi:hypothetical protein